MIKRIMAIVLCVAMVFGTMGISVFADETTNVAKVGSTEYATIDEAIAAWSNGTTLTLLADVTLSDVITLKSTEHHILDLGTYTMTAASNKNAIVIQACGTGSAERTAITINADATNPGGINAGKKSVIYYKYADGGISGDDRPIIKITGGVFTGSTSSFGTTVGIYTNGTAARKCATLNISGGTFNCSINGASKSKLIITGGTFNYSVGSQGDSTALRLISGGKFKTIGFMTADSNNTKFWIGTSMANSNVGVYVDDNGYIVVGGAPITEAGDTFKASSENYSGASSYLQYSSAKDYGLYYTSVSEAFADNNKTTGSVTVYVDELDMTNVSFKGTIVVPEGNDIKIVVAEGVAPAWTVSAGADAVSYTDAEGKELELKDGIFVAKGETVEGVTVTGAETVVTRSEETPDTYEITLAEGEEWTEETSVVMTLPAVEGAVDGDVAYVIHEHDGQNYFYVGSVQNGSVTFTNTVGFSTFTVSAGGLADALAVAEDGDVITLLDTIELSDTITIEKDITIDGDGNTITLAEGFRGNNVALFELIGGADVTFENATFDGIENVAVIRSVVADVTIDNCIIQNCAHASTNQQGLVRFSSGDVTITNTEFINNSCKMVVSFNYDAGNADDAFVVEDCLFENNTVSDTAAIYYVEGASSTISNNIFKNNTVTSATHGALIYYSEGENGVVSGNVFENNTITASGARAGVLGVEAGTTVSENAFISNTISSTASGATYVGTVVNKADANSEGVVVNGNYWGGNEPDIANAKGAPTTVENYYTEYENGNLNDLVELASSVAKVGDVEYASLDEAIAAAKSGDTLTMLADVTIAADITLPAGITLNGNGYEISGAVVWADGDLVIEGHTKVTGFNAGYNKPTITIGEGACLELTGTGRMVLGHGATFNITGSISDAKTADKATITPSLIAAGASFTGAGINFNVTNAYLKFTAYCSSKNSSANGTFNFNVTNSIWEQSNTLVFSEPTNGKDPIVNFNLKDSVLDTTSHLVFGVSKGEIVFDNSNVNVGNNRQLENRSTLTIKNGSVVYGAHATSSNAKNPGTTIVENATYVATGEFTGSDVGTGTLIIKKGANVTMGKITKANIVVDATDMTAGEVGLTANLSALSGTVSVINNNSLEAKIVDGKLILAAKPAAKIGETNYETIQAAINAAVDGDIVEIMPGEYSAFNISNKNITIKGTVADDGELLTTIKGGNPAITGHNFNGTIKDLKIVDAFKVMYAEPAGNVTADNVYVTGATYGFHLVAYSTDLAWTIQNSYMDLSWANSFGVYGGGDAAIVVKDNKFESTNPYYPEYGALSVNTFLPNVTVEGNNFGENTKIYIDQTVTDTSNINISKNYHADGVENAFADDADGVKVDIMEYYTGVAEDGTLTGLVVRVPAVAMIGDVEYGTLAEAIDEAQSGDTIVLLNNVIGDVTVAEDDNITIDLAGFDIVGTMNGITNNGTLTINDSVGTGKVYTTDVAAQARPAIYNTGDITINGGWFGDSNNDTTDRNGINRGNAIKNAGTAVINGGYFTNVSNQYIGSDAYAYAINTLAGGTTTINNATVYGDVNGLIFSDGTTVVENGSFTLGRPNEENNLWYLAYGNVEIKGGTWTRSFKVPSWQTTNLTVTGAVSVSGGKFSVEIPEVYIAEGLELVENEDGTFSVQEKKEEVVPFKDAPLFLAGLDDEIIDGVAYHPIYIATSIDSLKYQKVGFDYMFSIFDPETKEVTFSAPYTTETSEVYSSISDANTTYTVDSIGGNGAYLFMNKLMFNAEYYHNNNTKITITPYAFDMEGNKITGWTFDMTDEFYTSLQPGSVKQNMFKEAK